MQGNPDNFASPQDPVTPSPGLLARFPLSPTQFRNFDQPGIDRLFLETFDRLPMCITAAELAGKVTGPWVGTLTCFPGMKSAPQYPMAVERACWVGEPVAMVVAETRALAEDAAACIEVEWQELPAVAGLQLNPGDRWTRAGWRTEKPRR